MQRAVTPAIGILRTRAVANPLALLAAMYMLAASLPRKIGLMVAAITGRDSLDAGAAAGSATADAGDDAVEAELDGGEGGGAADGECDCEDEECAEEESTPVVRLGGDQVGEARATPSSATVPFHTPPRFPPPCLLPPPFAFAPNSLLTLSSLSRRRLMITSSPPSLLVHSLYPFQVGDAAMRASKLLARAVAAKEASGKAMAKSTPVAPAIEEVVEEAEEEESPAMADLHVSGLLGEMRMAARLRVQREARRQREAAAEDDGGGDADDGGDD